MGEVIAGVSTYNGDLTQQAILLQRLKPAVGFTLKYNSGDIIDFRIGLMFAQVVQMIKTQNDRTCRRET